MLLAIPYAERLLITVIIGSAAAFATAFAESYSQFVPGKTGMRTRGLATLIDGAVRSVAVYETFFGLTACVFNVARENAF